MNPSDFHLYCDAGFNTRHHIGVAGFLLLESEECARNFSVVQLDSQLGHEIQFHTFQETNNIRAELRGIIFALESIENRLSRINRNSIAVEPSVTLYTDCLSIAGLKDRRRRLESCDFNSKRTGLLLSNADLYRKFYTFCDSADFQIVWVKGHTPRGRRDAVHENFSAVDKAVREKLRKTIRQKECDVKSL
jgi:ribonuclease HI